MKSCEPVDLNPDLSRIRNHKDYTGLWERIGRLRITMVEQHEECRHRPGDTFIYENPYKKPEGVRGALLHVLDLYTWRAAPGFPSWNGDDRKFLKSTVLTPRGRYGS